MIEVLAPEVEEGTVPDLVLEEEEVVVVVTGVHQSQLLLVGEVVRPSPSPNIISLTCQKRVLQLL